MSYTHVLAAIVAGAIASTAAWQVQGWRYDGRIKAIQAQHAQTLADAKDAAVKLERGYQQQLTKARNDATKRETKLRRDADAARAAADGLRDGVAQFRARIPAASQPACAVAADTAAQLLGECASRYRDVAEQADRLVSDRQTLMDAWPTSGQLSK